MKTARMTKTRCRTCKGRDNCFHLNVLKQAETEKAALNENCRSGRLAEQAKKKTNVETDMLGGLAYKKENPKGKSKSKNENNPENFHGDAANVFGQQFQYPPTTADKENKPIKDGGSTARLPPCNKPKDQQSNELSEN